MSHNHKPTNKDLSANDNAHETQRETKTYRKTERQRETETQHMRGKETPKGTHALNVNSKLALF